MELNASALADTQAAFDGVAPDYGRQNAENPILAAMRRRTTAAITMRVPPGAHLLDLGCGPGLDAVHLARLGYRVTAIDAARAMVEQARAHARRNGCGADVRVRVLGIHELDRLGALRFDAAYSNFGALNCVPQLETTAHLLAAHLSPGAPLIASVIGRWCPWELALYAARRDWTRMRVRLHDGFVPVPLAGRTVWTRYYTPAGFTTVFEKAGFTRVSLRSLGLLVPPPYLEHVAHRRPRAIARLQAIEDVVAGWPGLRALGDHFLVVLVRN